MRMILSVVGILITFAIGMLFYSQWLQFGAGVPTTAPGDEVEGVTRSTSPLDAINEALEVKDLIENR